MQTTARIERPGYYAWFLIFAAAGLGVVGLLGNLVLGTTFLIGGALLLQFFQAPHFFGAIVVGFFYLMLTALFEGTQKTSFGFFSIIRKGIPTLLLLCLTSLVMVVTTNLIFVTADYSRFSETTQAVARLEAFLGGGYPPSLLLPGLLSAIPYAEALIFYSYVNTLYFLSILLVLLVLVTPIEARRYLLTLAIAYVIAIPFWILTPVGWPQAYYLDNTLSGTFSTIEKEAVADFRQQTFSIPITKALTEFPEVWKFDPNGALPVSGFPSMHAAWTILVIYFSRKVGRLCFAAASLFAGASLLGTIYLLQHFMIDLAGGIAIAFIAIYLAKKTPIKVGTRDPYWLFDRVHQDVQAIASQLKRDIGKVRKYVHI